MLRSEKGRPLNHLSVMLRPSLFPDGLIETPLPLLKPTTSLLRCGSIQKQEVVKPQLLEQLLSAHPGLAYTDRPVPRTALSWLCVGVTNLPIHPRGFKKAWPAYPRPVARKIAGPSPPLTARSIGAAVKAHSSVSAGRPVCLAKLTRAVQATRCSLCLWFALFISARLNPSKTCCKVVHTYSATSTSCFDLRDVSRVRRPF